jgi:hypothetical protein
MAEIVKSNGSTKGEESMAIGKERECSRSTCKKIFKPSVRTRRGLCPECMDFDKAQRTAGKKPARKAVKKARPGQARPGQAREGGMNTSGSAGDSQVLAILIAAGRITQEHVDHARELAGMTGGRQ